MDKENMNIAEGILFAAGCADAIAGVDANSPESAVAAYYAGRDEVATVAGKGVVDLVKLLTR